jgi:hypothetical protein
MAAPPLGTDVQIKWGRFFRQRRNGPRPDMAEMERLVADLNRIADGLPDSELRESLRAMSAAWLRYAENAQREIEALESCWGA